MRLGQGATEVFRPRTMAALKSWAEAHPGRTVRCKMTSPYRGLLSEVQRPSGLL